MSTFILAGRSTPHQLPLRPTVQRNVLRIRQRQLQRQRNYSTKPPERPQPDHGSQNGTLRQTIPGPAWAWVEPLAKPFRAYGRMQQRSPYMTQLSSSLTIYFLGDLSAQMVSGSGTGEAYEPIRGLRALVIGGISSIPSYKWFMFLGNHFNYGSHWVSIAVKIVINQTCFTPVFNTYFFGMQSLLTGSSLQEAAIRVRDTVPTSWRNSWKVWPAVTAFSFTFIPPQHRNVFAGVIAIGWQTYLSWLNRNAEDAEAKGAAQTKKPNVIENEKKAASAA